MTRQTYNNAQSRLVKTRLLQGASVSLPPTLSVYATNCGWGDNQSTACSENQPYR